MIELMSVEPRDETRQMAYFKVDEYEFSAGNIPIELDNETKVLTWLEKNEDFYMFLILQKMYRKGEMWADWGRFKTDENTNLAAFQKWISGGCKNKVQVGLTKTGKPKYEYEAIEKKEWKCRHPKWIGLTAKIEKATLDKEVKDLLKEIVKGD